VLAALRARRFDGLMAHHVLVDDQLVNGVREVGADVYAWTVDSAQTIRRVAATGVTGITTNDPRLFAGTL
jgi:glycerophosphoryl diester phosphodiesterase